MFSKDAITNQILAYSCILQGNVCTCMDAFIHFVICFFFLLGALGTPWANYGVALPKKVGQCHNATIPRSGIGPAGYHSWER